MNKAIAVLVVILVAGTSVGMAWRPKDQTKVQRVNACLTAASNAATSRDANGMVTGLDGTKLTAGYCTCYTAENDTQLMARYCA